MVLCIYVDISSVVQMNIPEDKQQQKDIQMILFTYFKDELACFAPAAVTVVMRRIFKTVWMFGKLFSSQEPSTIVG